MELPEAGHAAYGISCHIHQLGDGVCDHDLSVGTRQRT